MVFFSRDSFRTDVRPPSTEERGGLIEANETDRPPDGPPTSPLPYLLLVNSLRGGGAERGWGRVAGQAGGPFWIAKP